MDVTLREPGDRARLEELIRCELNVKQRDRYRAVLLATEGRPTESVMAMVGRSRGFVQRWAYVYRDRGIDAIAPTPQTGRPPTLRREDEAAFKRRLLAGPTEADGGVCTLRGEDARRILVAQFGVRYTLGGVYDLMHRLNLSCLKPRPRHRKNDPKAMADWVERAPLLSGR